MAEPDPKPPEPRGSSLQWLVAAIGGVCAAFGFLVVIGWHLHVPTLIQLRPTLAPMQYNTAVCFILAGMALCFWGRKGATVGITILGGAVALVGTLTLGEYIFHLNLGIDQLLFHPYIGTETSHLGRMSPVSSFCFTLSGLALLLLDARAAWRWRPGAVGALASLIFSISLVAVLGYLFGLPGTYGWGQLTRIAIHTATGFSILGAGLFIIAWQLGCASGERTPRWLPAPLALGIFTAALILFFALEGKQDQEIAQTVKAGAESVKNQIGVRMDGRIRSLVRMGRRWDFAGARTKEEWEADATNYVHDFPDLQALEWIDATHHVRWVIPLAGNEAKIGLDLTQEEHRSAAVEQAEREHQPVITHVVTLFRGGLGFVIYVPITVKGEPHGLMAAIFDASTCMQRYLPPAVAAGEAIRFSESGQLFYERDAGTPPLHQEWAVQEKIELNGAAWEMGMWPTPALAARLDSPLPEVVLSAGALGSLLLAAVCYFAQRSSRQATETRRANVALQAALDEVKTLEGLLPICSYCKRVRDDTGYWSQIDSYLRQHTRASFSHGYCPECAAKACREFGIAVPQQVQDQLAAGNFE